MQNQALGAAIFSTDLGRFPPRAPHILPGRIILRSNPEDDMNQKIAELQTKYPAHCKAIEDPPSNLYDYFDVYDQHLHGQLFLKSVLTEIGIRNKARRRFHEAKVAEYAQDWRSLNHQNFLLFTDFGLDSFTKEDIEAIGKEILVEVAQKLQDEKRTLVEEAEHAKALQLEAEQVDRVTQNASSVSVRVAPLHEDVGYPQVPRNFSAPSCAILPFRQSPVDQQAPFTAPKLAFDMPPTIPFNVAPNMTSSAGPMMTPAVSPSLIQLQTQQPGWSRHAHSNSFQSAPKEQYLYSTASYPNRRKAFYGDPTDRGVALSRPCIPDSTVAVVPSDFRSPHMGRREMWGPSTFLPPTNQARYQGKRRPSVFKGPANDARVLERPDLFQGRVSGVEDRARLPRSNRQIEYFPVHLRNAQGQPYAQPLETARQVSGSAIHPLHFVDSCRSPGIQPVGHSREHGETAERTRHDHPRSSDPENTAHGQTSADPSRTPYPYEERSRPVNSEYAGQISERAAQNGLPKTAPVTPKRNRYGTKISPDKAGKVVHSSPRQYDDPSEQKFDSASPDRKVWVGALRPDTDVQLLQRILSGWGPLETTPDKIFISSKNHDLSSSFPGFAFATYEKSEDAAAAVEALHETFSKDLDCKILLRPARPRWSGNSPSKQGQSIRRDKRDSSITFEPATGARSNQTSSPTVRRGARSDRTDQIHRNDESNPGTLSQLSLSKSQPSDKNAKPSQVDPEPSPLPVDHAQNPGPQKTPESAHQDLPSHPARRDQDQKTGDLLSIKRTEIDLDTKHSPSGPTFAKPRSTTLSPTEKPRQKDADLAGVASPESSLASTAETAKSETSPAQNTKVKRKKVLSVSKKGKAEQRACDPFVQEPNTGAKKYKVSNRVLSKEKKNQLASPEKEKLESTGTETSNLKENDKGFSAVSEVSGGDKSRVNVLSSDGHRLGAASVVVPANPTCHAQPQQPKTEKNKDASQSEILNRETFSRTYQEKSVTSSEAQTGPSQEETMADDLAAPEISVDTPKTQLGEQHPASSDASRKTCQDVVAMAGKATASSASNHTSKEQIEKKNLAVSASNGKLSLPRKPSNVLVATPTIVMPIKRAGQPKVVKSGTSEPSLSKPASVEQQTAPEAADGHPSSPDMIHTPSSTTSPALSACNNGESREIEAPPSNIINPSQDAAINIAQPIEETEASATDPSHGQVEPSQPRAISLPDGHVPGRDQAMESFMKLGSEGRKSDNDDAVPDTGNHQPVIPQKKKKPKGKKKSKTVKASRGSSMNEPKSTDADSRPPSALPKPETPFLSDENEPLPLPVVVRPQDNVKLSSTRPPRIYSSWAEKTGGRPGKAGDPNTLIEITVNNQTTFRSAKRPSAVFGFPKPGDSDIEKDKVQSQPLTNDEDRQVSSADFYGHLRGGDLIVVDKTDESEDHFQTAEVDEYLRKNGKAPRHELLKVLNQIEPLSYVQYDISSEPLDVQLSSNCATTQGSPESPEKTGNKRAMGSTIDAPELLKALGIHMPDCGLEEHESTGMKIHSMSDASDTSNIRFIEDNSVNKVDLLSAWPARAEIKGEPLTSNSFRPLLAHNYPLHDRYETFPAKLARENYARSGLSGLRSTEISEEEAEEFRASSESAERLAALLDKSYSQVTATPSTQSLQPGDIVEIFDQNDRDGKGSNETANKIVRNAWRNADPWCIPSTEPSWGMLETEPPGQPSGSMQDANGHSSGQPTRYGYPPPPDDSKPNGRNPTGS